MRFATPLFAGLLLLTGLLSVPLAGQSNPVPKTPRGWVRKTVRRGKPHIAFTSKKVKSPDVLSVRFYDRELLVDATLEQWTQNKLASSRPPLGGTWSGPVTDFTRQTANFYTANREFKVKDQLHTLEVNAVCVDKLHVRMAAVIKSKTGLGPHDSLARGLMLQLLKTEIEAAKKEKRGLAVEQSPPKIDSLKPGGKIKPGLYVGTGVARKDNKTGARFELVIFENGEYEFLSTKKKRDSTGSITYSAATGRLQIDKPFENGSYDWDEEFCIYGTDKSGKKVIHAQTRSWVRRLKWIRESDRLSPSEVKWQKEVAKAEANRYPHVTEPGEGIKPDEIEAVMYTWEMPYRNGAVQLDHFGYLLMKDGRVLDGLPVAPDTIDLPASRSRAPDSWGWWRKAKNDSKDRFEFAWPSRPQDYRMPPGKQVTGVAIPRGTRLSGDFGGATTEVQIISNYSSVRWWGIKFDKNGRFLKYRHGSTQMGGVPGMETLTTVAWNDEGTATNISGPYVVGGTSRKFNNPALDRMGHYEFDGYRLTLKFDSKRIEHHATFTNKEQSSIWFEGHVLNKKKPEK